MNFQDIPARILTIRVKSTDHLEKAPGEQPVFSVQACPTRPDEFEIRLKESLVFAKPVMAADVRRLNSELASGSAILAQLANPATDGSIELQIAFFAGSALDMGDVEIGVDEYVEKRMEKMERRRERFHGERLYRRLGEVCSFRQGDNAFFFLAAGPAIQRFLKPEESQGVESSAAAESEAESTAEPTFKNPFCVIGDGLRFVATETPLSDSQSIFRMSRLTNRDNEPDRALRLAKGRLAFVEYTQAKRIQRITAAQLAALTKDEGSYLKKWDEFGDLEGERLLGNAREIGVLHYGEMKQNRNGTVTVRILEARDSALNALADDDVPEVESVDDLPDYLENESLTFEQFAGAIEQKAEGEKSLGKGGRQKARAYYAVLGFDAASKSLTLAAERLPRETGALILSLAGEVAQIKRRMAARRAILEGRSANSQLGLLIEEGGQITPTRPPQKVRPLTAFVREKVFRKSPTPRQEEAIEIALNTPDIALIQGPPGTGKTTVIAAILERLNEMAGRGGASARGQILLTGFQHDAVENMIDRLSLNSLPVPKFGKRSGVDEEGFDVFEKNLEEWCARIALGIRARNPQIVEIELETAVKNLCLQYLQAPTRALAANLAGQIASLGVSILGEDATRWATKLAKHLCHKERLNDETNPWLDAARRLPVRPESFADDGPERAAHALDDLKEVLEENERVLLDRASLWRPEDGAPQFLKELAALKKDLLIRFSAPPVFRVEKQNDEVIALAEEAIKRIQAAGHSAKDAKSAALAEFLAELESNPYGMIDAVSDYSFAFAATCQQSVNRQMYDQKGITGSNREQKMEYEFVIVDEAARVSPRDLMVPMAQGKRIILVGDHRQLPHIIDEEVASQMEAGETGQGESDWLKKSMFQYLFSERLIALEKTDGIIRHVTLDTQYRMHPLLGGFVSRNFYERFDPSEKFESGRPASDFVHNLPDTDGKPAVWLEVAAEKGAHQREGTSWIRPVEAIAIARQLREWRNSEAGKNLSFGVISFYKAQAKLIESQFGHAVGGGKALRIGTVDSFQGMEFDVVFLSMVRTIPRRWDPRDDDREMQARRLFGHLCLYNRLNVSMSRQKKLLVVAGDSSLLKNDLAEEFIPGLVDFFKLCQTEGRVL